MTNPLVDLHQAICQNSRTDRLTILGPRNIEMYDKSSACPPSSRVSPFCLQQSPTGRATLGSRTLSDVASLCHLSLWCKKQSAPATAYKFWCSALPFSAPCASRSVTQQVSACIRTLLIDHTFLKTR